MTDGFQVTRSNLRAAAAKFRSDGEAFAGAMPANGPAPVDGGNWVINDALQAVLESVGLLHTQFAGVIANDSARLDASYREYQNAEDETIRLITGVTADPGKTK